MKPTALITGAASGLGLELARALSETHQLILLDRDGAALKECSSGFADVQIYCLDVTDTAALMACIEELNQLPALHLLFNNAGITHRSAAAETHPDVLRKVMEVDYLAPVQLTQALLPLLQRSNGKIITIGSMAGWMPVAERAGYCAAKAALHQYFETLRAEMLEDVSLLMVYPSFLATTIEQNALNGKGGLAQHPRSTIGNVHTAQWMTQRILRAIKRDQQRLFPDRFTYLASLLYRVAPRTYLRLMRRKIGH
ncbi:SDR family NAD(P)-dependent oxidoreductase [Pseudidiomarina insulisalsae]|uniref:Short-chain dehydrogenase n=1 Tax=Pseudidiomarina insulisalsae TaxID=575789 RepID=A0A432YMQ8_9GAMM|nr:SDR family NAD(P)-dependent oxidoreductase [Pseudidiomarina insulisalsae]RUO62223.1 short-chain dehydrogenase [Pseudidiomarina insulisalsae]